MSKTLIIVESPAKANTLSRYLGPEYQINASVGHIRDLPSSTLGVDVKNNFKPRYITMSGKEKVIRELKASAAKADRVLLATDPDREGEAIAWHLAQILKLDLDSPCRIAFNEITEPAVQEAVKKPRQIDLDLVNAQQARRILDRLVGYELSPLLWQKIRKGLSAGRVQSVATRIVVQREREIKAFVPVEYWLLTAFLRDQPTGPLFRARYHGQLEKGKPKKRAINNQQEVTALLQELKDQTWTVHNLKKGKSTRQPGAPFTTSTLQQDASRSLNFSSRRTMRVAQQLYEGINLPGVGPTALVTYIRTDSVRVSPLAEQEAKKYIRQRHGEAYVMAKPRRFRNKNAAQDAHEAIRPAHFDLPPDQVREQMNNDQYRLYKLIWDRFIASQMAAALIDTVQVDVLAAASIFRAKGESIRFPGWMAQYGQVSAAEEQAAAKAEASDELTREQMPDLSEGQTLLLDHLEPEQKFTQPPARYTEASLIKALEELGIGRPSTYAPTISTILDRQYVEKDRRWIQPTDLGVLVTEMLENHFRNIVDTDFTADMEDKLDHVESGETNWIELLSEFYPPFHEQIERAGDEIEKIEMPLIPTGEKCPTCQEGDLMIREGRYGKFIACSRYPACRHTQNVDEPAPGTCPKCGSGLLIKSTRKNRSRKFYVCDKKGSNPDCDFISWDLPIDGKHCEVCGTYMVQKAFRGRTYERCGNPDCPTNKRASKKKSAKPASSAAAPEDKGTDAAAADQSADAKPAPAKGTTGKQAAQSADATVAEQA